MKTNQLRKSMRIIVLAAFLLAACFQFMVPARVAQADVAAGFAEYFIPGPTAQIRPILLNNQTTISDSNIHNVITFPVTTTGLTLYYDHWENGYLAGAAGDETYSGFAIGNVVTFESPSIPYNHTSRTVCTGSTNPGGSTSNCYDGGDRIFIVGGAVSMSQLFWPSNTGTVYANAWEIYPDNAWVNSYTLPVGENLYGTYYADFDNVYLLVMASQDSTSVTINDPNTVANPDVSTTLNRGQATQLWHVNRLTTVNADKPVQVQWINGTQNASYDSRGHTLVPSDLWDNEYYSPVPSYSTTSVYVNIYIYNPNATSLTVSYQDSTGSSSCSVPAGATRSYRVCAGRYVPNGSAVYLSAGSNFFAVGEYETGGRDFNWGFSIIPSTSLRDEYYIAWAKGTTDLTANGSPVFVTPTVDDQVIYADYSPTNGVANVTLTLDRLQVGKIRDGDNDNTGMHVWSASPFAIVWGEDDQYASANNPYIDAGYTILPLIPGEVALELNKSANPTAIQKVADETVQFTLVVDTGKEAVEDIYLTDLLPPYFQYVPGSTLLTLPGGSEGAYGDPSITGSAAAGYSLRWPPTSGNITDMAANQTLTLKFSAITVEGIEGLAGDLFTDYADVYGLWNGILLNATSQAVVTAAVPGHIVVIKDAVADWLGPFEFNLWDQSKPYDKTQFFLKDHPSLPGQNTKSFGLLAGSYTVEETVGVGWHLVSATCESSVVGKTPTPADIDLASGETVTCTFVNYDTPTGVEISAPSVAAGAGFVSLTWDTFQEDGGLSGFNVYRSESALNPQELVNSQLISPKNLGGNAQYEFVDLGVLSGHTYYYWVEAVYADAAPLLLAGDGPAEIWWFLRLPTILR